MTTTITPAEAQLLKSTAAEQAHTAELRKEYEAAQLASAGRSLIWGVKRVTGLDRDRLELVRVRPSLVDSGRVVGIVRHVGTGRTVRVIGEDRRHFTYTTRTFRRLRPRSVLNRLVG